MVDMSRLVHLAQSGDKRGKEELFKIASRLAYVKISETIGYDQDADDVLQEVLFSLIQSLPKLREPHAFFKWFKRIVSNKLADHFRKKTRNRELSNYGYESIEHTVTEQDVQSSDWNDEIRFAVKKAVRELPPRNRLIVRLFYFEGLSCREVAEFLFTSSQAIKSDLYRIRRSLFKRIEKVNMNSISQDNTTDKPQTFQWITISGDKIAGKLFKPDSMEARVYLASYPISTLSAATSIAGVSEDEARKRLEWWAKYELIEMEGNQIRCGFPVLLREDYDMLLPWAERVAEPLTSQLEWLNEEALSLGKDLPDEIAQESVRVTSILTALTVGWKSPLKTIFKESKLKLPERKGLGRAAIGAAAGIEGLIQGFNGEIYLSSFSGSEPEEKKLKKDFVFALINPVGTSRKIFGGKEKNSSSKTMEPLWISVLPILLSRIGREGLVSSKVEKILRELLPSGYDFGKWIKEMVDTKALVSEKQKLRIGIPVISFTDWQKFTAYLEEVGKCVGKSLEDSAMDLAGRFSKCSFVHCNYTECLLLALTLVSNLMFERIKKSCSVSFPDEADFSWGTFIVLP